MTDTHAVSGESREEFERSPDDLALEFVQNNRCGIEVDSQAYRNLVRMFGQAARSAPKAESGQWREGMDMSKSNKEKCGMEKQIKAAVYEMLCNLKGQGLIGNNEDLDSETAARAVIRQEVDAQLQALAIHGLFNCPQ